MTRRSVLALAGAGLLGLGLAACGNESDSLKPSASVTTLMAGWEKHFLLEWTTESRAGGVQLQGTVTSRHGARAEPMRLLAQALDASGAVVGQQIARLPGGVGGFQARVLRVLGSPEGRSLSRLGVGLHLRAELTARSGPSGRT